MKKTGVSRKIKIFSSVTVILSIVAVITTLFINASVRDIMSQRDTRLDMYEATKLWVLEDIRSYLTLTEDTYSMTKSNFHGTSDIKNELFGGSYSDNGSLGYDRVEFVDAQYSIEEKDGFMVYILANVVKEGKKESINLLVSIDSNKIYDIVAY